MRLLAIINPLSLHVKRWFGHVAGTDLEVRLFPAYAPIENETDLWPWLKTRAEALLRPLGLPCDELPHPSTRSEWPERLSRLIDEFQPDVIHSMNIQETGYLVSESRALRRGRLPPWIVTPQGNDVHLFGRLDEHRSRSRAVLSHADFMTCECKRDLGEARALGFQGESLALIPACGGFDLGLCERHRLEVPPSQRKWILLKGYQNYSGRALSGLKAIELCSALLRKYRIGIYSAFPSVKLAASQLAARTGLRISTLPRVSISRQMIRHSKARVSMSLAISDGACISALEAMAMGSFPIQSDTGCTGEWFRPGRSGFLVPPEEPREIAAKLERVLLDDSLVDRAAAENYTVISERLDPRIVRETILEAYRRAAASRLMPGLTRAAGPRRTGSRRLSRA
jgi:hypothetical protein